VGAIPKELGCNYGLCKNKIVRKSLFRDGWFSFSAVGGRNHDIRVFDGQFNYQKTMFFERGGTKIINAEPGTAVFYV